MNLSNLLKKIDAVQQTETSLLVRCMKQAGLTDVRFEQQPVIQTKPKDGKSIPFKVEQIELIDSGIAIKGHDRTNPFQSITCYPSNFFPGEIAQLFDCIPSVDKNVTVSPRGIDNDIQAAIISAMGYLDDNLDTICDDETYRSCLDILNQLRKANEFF